MTSTHPDVTPSTPHPSHIVMRYITTVAWLAIFVGILLRLTQLPTRAVYADEEYTQLRVAGHTARELTEKFYNGIPVTAQVLSSYAIVEPSASPQRLLSSLEKEDSQHPPLFYLIELVFIKFVGNSLVSWRLLPAIFGILAIPAAYALARELFGNRHTALLAAAMFAVSPIERIYSDQAREYSLFALFILVSTLAVVRATRSNSFTAWAIYAAAATLGLYTDPIMAYVLAAHAIFILGTSRSLRSFTSIGPYIGATAVAVLAYSPWIYEIIVHRNDITETNVWSGTSWPFLRLAAKWIFNTGTTYYDLEYLNLRWGTVGLAAVSLAAIVAVIRAFRSADVETRWCLGAAAIIPAILLVAPDIIVGQHRSTVARYGLPVFAILAIIMARGLVGRPFTTTIILGAALTSCLIGSLHSSWWDNDPNADDARVAAAINAAPHAQIVGTIQPPLFVVFSRLLTPSVQISLSPHFAAARFFPQKPTFVYFPAQDDLNILSQRTGLRFERVPYARTQTAHDIGASIAAGADAVGTTGLYRATNAGRFDH